MDSHSRSGQSQLNAKCLEVLRFDLLCIFHFMFFLQVHKTLLAASSDYFRAMLQGVMRETKEECVDLKGLTAAALRQMLDFLYSGELELDFDNLIEVLNAASRADVTVLQVLGAANMSNRFYSVHPRRNDRFLRASSRLTALVPDVDFSQFSFTRHMLGHLRQHCATAYAEVVEELQISWFARMVRLIGLLQGSVILVWFAGQRMPEAAVQDDGQEALFVTRAMVDRLAPRVETVLDLTASDRALGRGTRGMVFDEVDSPAAERLMGPLAHEEAAEALATVVSGLLAATQRPATGAGLLMP